MAIRGLGTAIGANPTGTVGLSAVNGSLATFLRSDGAPALSQAIAPTWTGAHIWSPVANTTPLTVSGYSLTGANAQSLIDYSGTLNTSGNPIVFKYNLTNTASGATTKIFDYQTGGTTLLNLDKFGTLTSTISDVTVSPRYGHSISMTGTISSGGFLTTGFLLNQTYSCSAGSLDVRWMQWTPNITRTGTGSVTLRGFFMLPQFSGTIGTVRFIEILGGSNQQSVTSQQGVYMQFTNAVQGTDQLGIGIAYGDNGGLTNVTNLSCFHIQPNQYVGDFYGTNSNVTNFYGFRCDEQDWDPMAYGVPVTANAHGFAMGLDSNFVNNKYLYWSTAISTAYGSRSFGMRYNSATAQFEMTDASGQGVFINSGGIINMVFYEDSEVSYEDNPVFY